MLVRHQAGKNFEVPSVLEDTGRGGSDTDNDSRKILKN